MSEVYVHEPATKGKVVLHTTHGALDIELWSKECPKACRNFVQLCLEGYYDNTIFHRLIKDFIVQGGDPTGTGNGGESIYGAESFPEEFHSRLKYRYRGLVGVANRGRANKTNGSQFFITLGRADALNNLNTLFGKVSGHTVYNLVHLASVECNKQDRPIDPPKVKRVEVLWNPFDDIIPRNLGIQKPLDAVDPKEEAPVKREALQTLQKQLLSFDDEDDDDAAHSAPSSKQLVVTAMRSAHDVLVDDPTLDRGQDESPDALRRLPDAAAAQPPPEGDCVRPPKLVALNADRGALKSRDGDDPPVEGREASDDDTSVSSDDDDHNRGDGGATAARPGQSADHSDASKANVAVDRRVPPPRKRESENLHHDAIALKKRVSKLQQASDTGLLTDWERRRQAAMDRSKKAQRREQSTSVMDKLMNFRSRLREETPKATEKPEDAPTLGLPNLDEVIDESDGSWMHTGGLKFGVDASKAFELAAAAEMLTVYDPLLHGKGIDNERQRRNERLKPSLEGARPAW